MAGGSKIGTLEIQLLADVASIKRQMDEAKNVIGGAMGEISGAVRSAQSLMFGLTGALLGISSAGAFKGLVMDIVSFKVELQHLSVQTGASVESLGAIAAMGKLVGTNVTDVGAAINKMQKNLASSTEDSKGAAQALDALNINFKDFNSLKADQQLLAVAKSMNMYEDGAGKAAAAQLLFGRSGAQLLPLLKEMADKNELVGKHTAESAKQAEEFDKQLKKLDAASGMWKKTVVESMLPALADVAAGFAAARKEGFGFWGMLREGGERLGEHFGLEARRLGDIRKMREQIGFLENQKDSTVLGVRYDPATTAEMRSQRDADIASMRAELQRKEQEYFHTGGGAAGGGRGFTNPAFGKNILDPNLGVRDKPAGTVSHFGDNLINSLVTEYNNLSNSINKVEEVQRKLDTASEKVSDSQRKEALALAANIDQQTRATASAKALADITVSELAAREKLEADYDAGAAALNRLNRDQQFELSLLNRLPEVQATARFGREQMNQALEQEAKLVAMGLQKGYDEIQMDQERVKIKRELAERQAAFNAIQNDAYDKSYNPMRGEREALKDYLIEVSKLGETMNRTVGGAFRNMEDALVNFVKTGKLDFSSLADQIVSDMARIQIRQSITGPLAEMMQSSGGIFGAMRGSGLLGSLFGQQPWNSGLNTGGWMDYNAQGALEGARASGGPVLGGRPYLVGENGPEIMVPNGSGTVLPNGGGAAFAPVTHINIDSRTDRADVFAGVSNIVQQNNRQLVQMLRDQGALA